MFFRAGSAVKNAVGVDIAVSDEMQDAVELWQKMFQNKAPWIDDNTQSMGLASAIAGEYSSVR